LIQQAASDSAFPVWYGMGKAHGHVSVIEAHAVCDGFSKLLKILAARGG
jgi:hypothetical protein